LVETTGLASCRQPDIVVTGVKAILKKLHDPVKVQIGVAAACKA
jgi:hypothetical protein